MLLHTRLLKSWDRGLWRVVVVGWLWQNTTHKLTGCISGCGFELYWILISSLNTMHKTLEKVGTGYRLPPPPGCPRMIYKLMIQCWWVRFMHACLLLCFWLQAIILMQASYLLFASCIQRPATTVDGARIDGTGNTRGWSWHPPACRGAGSSPGGRREDVQRLTVQVFHHRWEWGLRVVL